VFKAFAAGGVMLVALLTVASRATAQTALADPPEIRALWIDAFHAGIRSQAEVDELVAAARRVNLNTLFVQVRRRGDALYTKGIEPPLDDPAYDPAFDALASIVDAGHRAGLEVHAWVNAMPTWRDELPPKDPRHVFNRHGPAATGDDNWFTSSPTGEHKFPVGYFLDPGHPAAAAYLADIYVNIVRNYAVDGIHFDYVRYPETDERLPRGSGVGYNTVSLARFRRAAGRTDTPEPGDEEWMEWRRTQVTNLVRRVSIEAKAINPRVKISAALIPWGQPPSGEKDFSDVAPMQRIFQDWHQWLREGLLDLGAPMNYATETDERVRGWFDGWIRWEKRHKHDRQLVVGLGAYRNTPEHTLSQIARVRKAEGGARVDGVSFFSYASPHARDSGNGEVVGLAFLTDGAGTMPGAFTQPAPIPSMPWIERPTHGWIAGVVGAPDASGVDGAAVKVKRTGFPLFRRTRTVQTDGNGYYGLTNVKPGRYHVWVDGAKKQRVSVTVEAGKVSRAVFDPPGPSR
jgi:uncharacterized lipoprotein YddW (UPF0748 family)